MPLFFIKCDDSPALPAAAFLESFSHTTLLLLLPLLLMLLQPSNPTQLPTTALPSHQERQPHTQKKDPRPLTRHIQPDSESYWHRNKTSTSTMIRPRCVPRLFALVCVVQLLLLVLLSLNGVPAAAAKAPLDCTYCQGRGFPYVCKATMESGICFVNSGDMRCEGEKGCECCRTASAAGCTLCSMEADWDAYDDDEDDI